MAIARQEQSNAMLYTVITFVGLFIVATVAAVVFYIKAEDWRNQYQTSIQQMEDLATSSEVQSLSSTVGQKDRTASRTRQLLGYIDKLYKIDTGSAPKETSAEAKISEVEAKYQDIITGLPKDFVPVAAVTNTADVNDANMAGTPDSSVDNTGISGPGVFRIIEVYGNKLSQKDESISQLNANINNINSEFDAAKQGAAEREKELLAQIGAEQQKADGVQQSYNQLRELMNKKADEQVQMLLKQRDEAIDEKNKIKQDSLATMNKLTITQDRLQDALGKLDVLKPRPKEDVAAYNPDGHIIAIDIASNLVFIDIGSEAKVYPGLTFSAYSKNTPIPTEGTSKAEIEVFNVEKNTATARIVKSSKKNPIMEGDIIVNLIWDSKEVNRFVVAGAFDFNGDGAIDSDGAVKVKQLIEGWGGKVEDIVTIDTDFVVFGMLPTVPNKPGLDAIEADPMATEKYEAALKASEQYQEIKNQAKDLYIPVFNLKRFLSFIGYESLASGTKAK